MKRPVAEMTQGNRKMLNFIRFRCYCSIVVGTSCYPQQFLGIFVFVIIFLKFCGCENLDILHDFA